MTGQPSDLDPRHRAFVQRHLDSPGGPERLAATVAGPVSTLMGRRLAGLVAGGAVEQPDESIEWEGETHISLAEAPDFGGMATEALRPLFAVMWERVRVVATDGCIGDVPPAAALVASPLVVSQVAQRWPDRVRIGLYLLGCPLDEPYYVLGFGRVESTVVSSLASASPDGICVRVHVAHKIRWGRSASVVRVVGSSSGAVGVR